MESDEYNSLANSYINPRNKDFSLTQTVTHTGVEIMMAEVPPLVRFSNWNSVGELRAGTSRSSKEWSCEAVF